MLHKRYLLVVTTGLNVSQSFSLLVIWKRTEMKCRVAGDTKYHPRCMFAVNSTGSTSPCALFGRMPAAPPHRSNDFDTFNRGHRCLWRGGRVQGNDDSCSR